MYLSIHILFAILFKLKFLHVIRFSYLNHNHDNHNINERQDEEQSLLHLEEERDTQDKMKRQEYIT